MRKSILRGVALGALAALAPVTAHAAVVAEWRMNEPSGAKTMADSATGVGGANDGTITNVKTGVPALVSGRAYEFGGAASHVTVPHHSSLNPGTATISLGASVKIPDEPLKDDSYDIVRKGETTTAGGYWKMEVKRNRTYPAIGNLNCVFKVVTPTGAMVSYSRVAWVDIADGRKRTVECVKTASSVIAKVDGRVFGASAGPGWIANTEPVIVGSRVPGDDVFQGVLDQVAVAIG